MAGAKEGVPVTKQDLCTSRKAAELLGVTPRTIQLWADSGILSSWKTPGGHRRFSLAAIERLAAEIRAGKVAPRELRASPPASEPAAAPGPVRVQVIDDEPGLQRMYAMTFRHWGVPIELRQSLDGYQGLLELGQFYPHLLLLDLHLPNIDGFSIIEAVHRQGLLAQMQLMVVTALNHGQVQRRVADYHPGIEVLPKPIPFQRIRDRLDLILRQHEDFS